MIKTKTVFILGAGASMPYGFPSGAELREMLCASVTRSSTKRTIDWISQLSKLGISERDSLRFADAFFKSGVASIDSFLSRRMGEFGEVGKTAIAAILCAFEEPFLLHKADNDDDWYIHLWNALVAGVHKYDDLANNQIRFVTFNYDRSLEYFLLQSCEETFGVNRQVAEKAIENLKIIHVYGQLGKFAQDSSSEARAYDSRVGSIELSVAAKGIKIIPESRDDSPEFKESRKFVEWADRLCFLGFGFDQLNMSRLNLEPVLKARHLVGRPLRIVASTYGKTLAEINAIEKEIPSSSGWWERFYSENLRTIRQSGVLL